MGKLREKRWFLRNQVLWYKLAKNQNKNKSKQQSIIVKKNSSYLNEVADITKIKWNWLNSNFQFQISVFSSKLNQITWENEAFSGLSFRNLKAQQNMKTKQKLRLQYIFEKKISYIDFDN